MNYFEHNFTLFYIFFQYSTANCEKRELLAKPAWIRHCNSHKLTGMVTYPGPKDIARLSLSNPM